MFRDRVFFRLAGWEIGKGRRLGIGRSDMRMPT